MAMSRRSAVGLAAAEISLWRVLTLAATSGSGSSISLANCGRMASPSEVIFLEAAARICGVGEERSWICLDISSALGTFSSADIDSTETGMFLDFQYGVVEA